MQLRDVGDRCIVDFSEISDVLFGELFRWNAKLNHDDRRKVERIIGDMADDYMTRSMYWTKRQSNVDIMYYVEKFDRLLDKHPDPELIIEEARDKIAELLMDLISLPTWHEVYMQSRGTAIEMEMGPDYRITDWMKRHAKEYITCTKIVW